MVFVLEVHYIKVFMHRLPKHDALKMQNYSSSISSGIFVIHMGRLYDSLKCNQIYSSTSVCSFSNLVSD